MSFLNPMAFLLLLSVPLLVLLYFLKLKRPQVRVGSTLLWQKVIEDVRVNSPFQKLKRSLLLWLQLLALLALIFALTRPTFNVQDRSEQSLIVLLDTSASMSARDPESGETRLKVAKDAVDTLIRQLGRHDELMLISFNSKAEMVASFTNNKRRLREFLKAVEASECPTRLAPALALAGSVASARESARILVVSDGDVEPLSHMEMAIPLEYIAVGGPAANVAITGLDVRRSMHDRRQIEMFVSVQNFAQTSFSGNMVVRLDKDVLDSKFIEIGGEETLSKIFTATLDQGGRLSVELDLEDALEIDNRAWKIIAPPTQRRVLLVGDAVFFLEHALRASPGIQFDAIAPEAYSASRLEGASVVIWNNVPAPQIAPCDNLYFNCAPPEGGIDLGERIQAPDAVDWDTSHPATRFLDFSNLIVSEAGKMDLVPTADVILSGSRTALIAQNSHPEGTLCVVGFDPLKSNWPLLVSFPLFLNNIFNHFDELRSHKMRLNMQVGRPLTATWEGGRPRVILPDGRSVAMEGSSGRYSFSKTLWCGVYSLVPAEAGRDALGVAVNLFDRRESRLQVADTLEVGRVAATKFEVRKNVRREYWRHGAVALLVLLFLEWLIYHRRFFS